MSLFVVDFLLVTYVMLTKYFSTLSRDDNLIKASLQHLMSTETNLNKPAVGCFILLHIAIAIKGIVTRTPPVAFVGSNYEPRIRMYFVRN